MQARWITAAFFLATLGCSTRSTWVPTDGGAKQDGAPSADLLMLADAFEVAGKPSDLAARPEDAPQTDASPKVSDDLASPDSPLDHPCSRCDASPSDVLATDVILMGDSSTRDTATESAPIDVASPEVAPLDLAGDPIDAIFSSIDGVPAGLDGPLAEFCTGNFAHMVVNGVVGTPAPTGRILALDCCDAGEISLNTATFAQPIVVTWRAQAGATSSFPATIDLASPPKDWTVQVVIGCQSAMSSCNPAPDSYTAGLQGTLQVSRTSPGYDMSLCLHVEEPPGSPHPIVHALNLYFQHVKTN